MKTFMLGWEFPPFISGGLGTACLGLTKAMDQMGMKVTFVLPRAIDDACASHVKLLSPSSIRVERLTKNEQLKEKLSFLLDPENKSHLAEFLQGQIVMIRRVISNFPPFAFKCPQLRPSQMISDVHPVGRDIERRPISKAVYNRINNVICCVLSVVNGEADHSFLGGDSPFRVSEKNRSQNQHDSYK